MKIDDELLECALEALNSVQWKSSMQWEPRRGYVHLETWEAEMIKEYIKELEARLQGENSQ